MNAAATSEFSTICTYCGAVSNVPLAVVWLLVAERNAWPGGHNGNASWRRTMWRRHFCHT